MDKLKELQDQYAELAGKHDKLRSIVVDLETEKETGESWTDEQRTEFRNIRAACSRADEASGQRLKRRDSKRLETHRNCNTAS